MIQTFLATLDPMLTLFTCMVIGFVVRKTKILPDNSGTVMARLETWVFIPAISFSVTSTYCTIETLTTHTVNILLGCFCVALSMSLAIPVSKLIIKEKSPERGIYAYALAFANGGYIGDPVVMALFGDEVLSYYKLFYVPFSIMIYLWGIGVLVPKNSHSGKPWLRILNAPTVALFIGVIVGLCGLGDNLPTFAVSTLNSLKSCMGPVGMLLAGFTVAGFDFFELLKNKKVYLATALRLIVIPTLLVVALWAVKECANLLLDLNIGNLVLYLAFFAIAAPLGLNTVVFPAAYGGDSRTGASMAMISHTLCIISIPLMYTLMTLFFGPLTI